MISIRRFYEMAILLPLFLPAIAFLGALVFGLPVYFPLSSLVNLLIMSGWYGAIPYSFLALWASRQITSRSENEIRRFAIRAPVAMAVVFLPYAFVIGALDGDTLEGIFVLIYAIPFTLLFGYAYVALVFSLRRIAEKRRWIALQARDAT